MTGAMDRVTRWLDTGGYRVGTSEDGTDIMDGLCGLSPKIAIVGRCMEDIGTASSASSGDLLVTCGDVVVSSLSQDHGTVTSADELEWLW